MSAVLTASEMPSYLRREGEHLSVKFLDGAPTSDPWWTPGVQRFEMVVVEDPGDDATDVLVRLVDNEFTLRVPFTATFGRWLPITNPDWRPYLGQVVEEVDTDKPERFIIRSIDGSGSGPWDTRHTAISSRWGSGVSWKFDDPVTTRRVIRVVPHEEQTWTERVISAELSHVPWTDPYDDVTAFQRITFDPPAVVRPQHESVLNTVEGAMLEALLTPGWDEGGMVDYPTTMDELILLVAEHVEQRERALAAGAP